MECLVLLIACTPTGRMSQGLARFLPGKEGKATIVLEAVADYHLWFWHTSMAMLEQ
jgi:hypothetical protein